MNWNWKQTSVFVPKVAIRTKVGMPTPNWN